MTELPANPIKPAPAWRPHRHKGSCGPRSYCTREACRRRFDPFKTVERVPATSTTVYHCHWALLG